MLTKSHLTTRLLLRNLKKQENTDAAARMQKKVEVSAAQLAKEPFNKKKLKLLLLR